MANIGRPMRNASVTRAPKFQEAFPQSPTGILSESKIIELRDLLGYGNKFHHDTNAALKMEQINEQELLNFCKRTPKFTSRS